MSTITLKISSVNQVTLPRVLREMLGVGAGDEIEVDIVNGVVQLRKAETDQEKVQRVFQELDEWRNNLPDEVKENIKKHAGWTANQYRDFYKNTPEYRTYAKERYGI